VTASTDERTFTTNEDISSVRFWSRSFVERDETFRRLRENNPVSWHPPLETPELSPEVHGERGFWAVVRGEDVSHVSRHPELFSSDTAKYGSLSILLRPAHPAIVERPTFLGMNPHSEGVVEPWCADFVSWVMREARQEDAPAQEDRWRAIDSAIPRSASRSRPLHLLGEIARDVDGDLPRPDRERGLGASGRPVKGQLAGRRRL
jgi:hypothetical protein